jgi:uncharacterized Zn finger protein (UPF0148 family)
MSETNETTQRWELYFRESGCVVCGRKDVEHAGHGFCPTCRDSVTGRLKQIIRENR